MIENRVEGAMIPAMAPVVAGRDRALSRMVVIGGVVCFALLAWAHLGLGALVAPPSRTATTQIGQAGPWRVTLTLASGQMAEGNANTVTLRIAATSGTLPSNTTIVLHQVMTTMPMAVPDVTATRQADGSFIAHPLFDMPGAWQIYVTIAIPGETPQRVTFPVSVQIR
jgi:hypothetical protein